MIRSSSVHSDVKVTKNSIFIVLHCICENCSFVYCIYKVVPCFLLQLLRLNFKNALINNSVKQYVILLVADAAVEEKSRYINKKAVHIELKSIHNPKEHLRYFF